MRQPGRPRARLVARLAASAGALVVVALVVGGDAVRAGAAVLAPAPVLAALGLGALWRALATTRWWLLARALGAPLVWSTAYAEYFRSELVNQVVPGGVVGDVDRTRRHADAVGWLPAGRAVVLERGLGQVVLLVATALAVLARPDLLGVAAGADARTAWVLTGVAVLVVALALAVWQPWRRARGAGVARADAGPRSARKRSALALALGLGAVASVGVLACFVALFVVAARATGHDAPVVDLLPAVLVTLVVSAVPLTVSGWGAREAGAALAFGVVGLGAAAGVAASVGYGLLALVAALPGLLPLALPGGHRGAGVDGAQVEVEADVVAEPERP